MTLAVTVHTDAAAELEAAAVWTTTGVKVSGCSSWPPLTAPSRTLVPGRTPAPRSRGCLLISPCVDYPLHGSPITSRTSQARTRSLSSPSLMTIGGPATGRVELPTRPRTRSDPQPQRPDIAEGEMSPPRKPLFIVVVDRAWCSARRSAVGEVVSWNYECVREEDDGDAT